MSCQGSSGTNDAADASNEAGYGGPGAAALTRNGALTFLTERTLVLRVSEDAFRGDAQFVTRANGQEVGGVQTVTAAHGAGMAQDVTLAGRFGDVATIAIEFLNDAYAGTGQDRNLYVVGATLDGRALALSAAQNIGGGFAGGDAVLERNGILTLAGLLPNRRGRHRHEAPRAACSAAVAG